MEKIKLLLSVMKRIEKQYYLPSAVNVMLKLSNSRGYTHLGFGALRRVNGLGWVQLRFHVTLGDAVTQ